MNPENMSRDEVINFFAEAGVVTHEDDKSTFQLEGSKHIVTAAEVWTVGPLW